MENDYYYENFTKIFKNIIEKSEIRVVKNKENPDIIESFMFSTEDVLHFVYTRKLLRGKGQGFDMVRDLIKINENDVHSIKVSFITKDFYTNFAEKIGIDVIYEPFSRYI